MSWLSGQEDQTIISIPFRRHGLPVAYGTRSLSNLVDLFDCYWFSSKAFKVFTSMNYSDGTDLLIH